MPISSSDPVSRRAVVLSACAASFAAGRAAAEPYRLGCLASLYGSLPLAAALERIRKLGFRYTVPSKVHAGENVYTTDLPAARRAEVRRQFADHGVEPFMAFGGFSDIHLPGKLDAGRAELDLCAGFGVPIIVAWGPWYYQRFPNLPRAARDWEKEVAAYYPVLEKLVRHAESAGVTIAMKPHTGITANARACLAVLRRIPSERLKICWDAGNVSFYEGIHPDPDLPELSPQVKAVCLKDHLGLRGDANFPAPGQGQINHEEMFRTLFGAGFAGPLAIERVDGRDTKSKLTPEVTDERLAAAYRHLAPILDRVTARL
ncbi:MAG: sugar phosphate isomerase/epimerase [Acidobacteria bacterium]|nr:sugar phosphate isomerase/epimerase [Acidobacteriota bacterium]